MLTAERRASLHSPLAADLLETFPCVARFLYAWQGEMYPADLFHLYFLWN
jgi:hypothetical protein